MLKTHDVPLLGRDDVFIMRTLDGSNTLFSKAWNSTYHSLNGAVSESRHVFLQNGLETLPHKNSVSILEFGFGTGLNAFLAFLHSSKRDRNVLYTGIEAFPIDTLVADQLDYPAYLASPHHQDIFHRMHKEEFLEHDKFQFTRVVAFDQLNFVTTYDCIFFDAFSPGIQPEQWEQNIFDHLFALTSDDGCLVTYCAKGEIRRRMQKAGYHVKRLNGAPGKREMLQALKL